MSKKHILIGILTIAASTSFSFAASVTAPQIDIVVSSVASLKIVSPQAGTFSGNDTVSVTVEATNVVGPLYIYLFDTTLRRVVATSAFPKSALNAKGPTMLRFDLSKSKAQASIAPGSYTIAACDMGKRDSLCVQSRAITISPEALSLSSRESISVYPNTPVIITGTGFDGDAYVLLDGGWSSLATLRPTGTDTASLTLYSGVPYGTHTIQIAKRGTFAPSNALSITVLEPRAPTITSVTKSGSVYTVTGSGMSRVYPSKVEILRNGQSVSVIDPSQRNTVAIASDGMSLRFQLDSALLASDSLSIRIINTDSYKSNVLPLVR